jgi:hypothetical protein
MSTRPHTPMAFRLVEDTGVKHLPMRHSGRRQALGVLLGGLFLLGLGTPHLVQAQEKKVPTEAANAGFTTLAQSWDFSKPLYAVQSNWYDCNGSLPNVLFHQGNPGVSLKNPCNVFQINDGGVTVMDFQYLTSYEGNGFSGQFNQIGGQTFDNFNNTVSIDFPNMFIETVARVARTYSTPQNLGGPNDVWTWSTLRAPTGGTYALEMDVFELYEDQGGFGNASFFNHDNRSGGFNWTSYGTNHLPSSWSPTAYHKYGMLLTSDGATEIYGCSFVDDIFQGCQAANAASDTALFTSRNRIIASAGSNSATAAANIDLDIQYINVYSCANWKAQMCNGSALFNSGGLTYWHLRK